MTPPGTNEGPRGADRGGPGRRTVLLVVALLWFLAIQIVGFAAFAPLGRALLRTVTAAALLAVLTAGLVGWGLLVLRWIDGPERQRLGTAWSFGAVLSSTVLAWLAPWWFPDAHWRVIWVLVGCGLCLVHRRSLRLPHFDLVLGPRGGWLLAFLLPPLLLALAPAVSLDSLVYHLSLPEQFGLMGRAIEMPWSLVSYFPLHAEMVYALALPLGGGVLAQLVHFLVLAMTLSVVARLGDRVAGTRGAVWAPILLLSVPVLNLVGGWAWNEWFILLYLALALEVLVDERTFSSRGFLKVAVWVGAAVATKYTALPLLVLLLWPIRRTSKTRLVLGAAATLVVGLPWYVRNLLLTGNPVYPLFSDTASGLAAYRGDLGLWERFLGYLARPDLVDESPGVLLLALLPLLWLWRRRWSRETHLLWAITGLYLAAAVAFHPTIRAFAPLFLTLSLLLGGALSEVFSQPSTSAPRWLRAALVFGLVVNLAQIAWVVRSYEPLDVVIGRTTDESYLTEEQSYVVPYRIIAENTPPELRVMVVGESRIFDLERPAIAGTFLDPHPITHFMAPDCDTACVAYRLKSEGVGILYVNTEQYRGAEPPPAIRTDELEFHATPEADAVFRDLVTNHTQEVFTRGPVQVLALR